MKRFLGASLALALLSGCMSANDPDAQTHCLIASMCLDIAGNRGSGPGFSGAMASMFWIPNQVNAANAAALSDLGHNLAVIGAHSSPIQVRIVP
jgi:hypothetical protein